MPYLISRHIKYGNLEECIINKNRHSHQKRIKIFTDLNISNLSIFIPTDILGKLDIILYILCIGFYCEKHNWNHKIHTRHIKSLKVKKKIRNNIE